MSVKKVFAMIFLVMGAVLLCLAATISMLYRNSVDLKAMEDKRHYSYLLADELRQSSDDLTRMARVYVITGDPKYLKIYNDILDIRNGKKPRPIAYERIYWDFIAAGEAPPRGNSETIPLRNLMQQAGYTAEEFALLTESEKNSNGLVTLEVLAMDAVEGKISAEAKAMMLPDETNDAFARRIVHDDRYHKYKALIMISIDSFLEKLDLRTAGEVESLARRQTVLFRAILAAGILMLCSVVASYLYISRNVSAPIPASWRICPQPVPASRNR